VTPYDSNNWLFVKRIVRFGDTDAAGVMHFHQLFRWSHEAWEESLGKFGVNYEDIFPSSKDLEYQLLVALPIIHCEADFWRPIYTGNNLVIELVPRKLDHSSFEVKAKFQHVGDNVAIALLRHCAINIKSRERSPLPESIDRWLEASSANKGISPLA